ncbi:Ppx/GppA phosphatase family protein [Corynebacterium aquatimens]|uniref:Exopolyphosphatase/guanosine-5'-triphosphate, 3'-diphosphate pyrophosphatase n=1 Tax=Corynebacterium aquatimens TaxID=1190508 RepID=A0A931GXN8_9CORY|nr:Ppx/GppA phosphatase family protein [Corynebacterium aquatimens]MBG6122054.1 exopolyphosphatase/guanosine-5'-triphosphate,3'-diphosphate pyrophosphatase [Corynebacterium aquatimens]WJY65405.1 Guanosine-5'-triphosphate,3'-diphosphate pyrophosphatase [Corynebacterium aquatimens]
MAQLPAGTRVAGVDCGTNSIRLLISEVEESSTGTSLTEITRSNTIVRLGQGVDETGELHPDAIARTRDALANYVAVMEAEGVSAVRMVATSATRDAANKDAFFDMTRELLGRIQPGACAEVITGEEEARLSFLGATIDAPADAKGPFCVVDLGGGSTEFIVGTRDGDILGAYSTRMGCVRLTERIMVTDPPTAMEIAQARAYVVSQIEEALVHVPLSGAEVLVGCAGTFTTISALTLGLDSYDPERIHMSKLDFDDVRTTTRTLTAESAATRAANPVMHPGRADVIGSGAVVVEEVLAAAERVAGINQLIVSEKDILDGIVAGLVSGLNSGLGPSRPQ